MDSADLNVSDALEYCKNNCNDNDSLKIFLSHYFSKRIAANKIYSVEEMGLVDKLVEFIKSNYNEDEKTKNRILKKARNLCLFSQDALNGTDNYNEVCKFERNFSSGYDNKDFFNYVKILLDNVPSYIPLFHFESQINNYLGKHNTLVDNKQLLDLIEKHPNLSLLDSTQDIKTRMMKKLRKSVSKSYISSLCDSFHSSINGVKISYDEIINYLRIFDDVLNGKVDNKLSYKLRRSIDAFLDDQYAIIKFDDVNDYYKVRSELEKFNNKIGSIQNSDVVIRDKIRSGRLVVTRKFPSNLSINYKFDNLDIASDVRIITIDDAISPDLDTAFSIKEIDGVYILNVFVSDVPDFLKYNRDLSKLAYDRGNSLYIHNFKEGNISIDMLPPSISHKCLSCNVGYPTNAIEFNFVIGNDGEIYSKSVSRKRIKVTDKLTPKEAECLINSDECMGNVQSDLKTYVKLGGAVVDKSKDLYMKMLDIDKISDLVGFASILVNYYVGHETEFAIYRSGGKYTAKADTDCYTHSVTPLRRFVSNINLAFFLEQNSISSFPERDLARIQNNTEEIVEHLNDTDNLNKFTNRNPGFVKKYLR